jgi:hypothetical protein
MTKKDISTTIEVLRQADYGSHYLIIYPGLTVLRQIYSRYIKTQLEENNELIFVIPYYETTDKVRYILNEKINDNNNDSSSSIIYVDVRKYEKEGSLVIIDSVRAYFKSKIGLESFIQKLVKQAESLGKSAVSVIADSGSFSLFGIMDKLIEYELSLPSKYDIALKRFCICNQKDFDRFTEEQKQMLLRHHGNTLFVTSP